MFPVCGIRLHWLKLYKTQLTGCYPITAVELCENSSCSYDALTDLRLQEWIQERQENFVKKYGWRGSRTTVSRAQPTWHNRRCGAG